MRKGGMFPQEVFLRFTRARTRAVSNAWEELAVRERLYPPRRIRHHFGVSPVDYMWERSDVDVFAG